MSFWKLCKSVRSLTPDDEHITNPDLSALSLATERQSYKYKNKKEIPNEAFLVVTSFFSVKSAQIFPKNVTPPAADETANSSDTPDYMVPRSRMVSTTTKSNILTNTKVTNFEVPLRRVPRLMTFSVCDCVAC